jgi:hypothetical protein
VLALTFVPPQSLRYVFHSPHAHSCQVHLDQSFFHRGLAAPVALNNGSLEGQAAQLRNRQRHFAGLGLEPPIVAARPRILAPFGALILPGAT